jgi:hypothetical protein
MPDVLEQKRSRASAATTNLIPLGRIAPQDLYQRIVPRKVFFDPCSILSDCSSRTLPFPDSDLRFQQSTIRGTTGVLDNLSSGMPTVPSVSVSGCYQVAPLKQAQQELLNLNRAALQAYIHVSQEYVSWISDIGEQVAGFYVDTSVLVHMVESQMQPDRPAEELPPFYEPTTIEWTKEAHEVRQAARSHNESSNADH